MGLLLRDLDYTGLDWLRVAAGRAAVGEWVGTGRVAVGEQVGNAGCGWRLVGLQG